MKDITNFPVVGSKYCQVGLDFIRALPVVEPLELVPEPENPHDSNAIAVYARKEQIGYVPNKGVSCNVCWTSIKGSDSHCKHCGAGMDHFVPGGLATRINKSGVFDKDYACYIEKTDPTNEAILITACLVIADGL
jgi:hypothetical protein